MKLSRDTLAFIRSYEAWIPDNNDYLYRGLSDKKFKIKSSLHVAQENQVDYEKDKIKINLENIAASRKLAACREFNEESDISFLAKLQHYGGKTPMIDFTRCPYIGLWFACCSYNKTADAKVVSPSEQFL